MKFLGGMKLGGQAESPPSRWSGLKSGVEDFELQIGTVSTLAVEWIEMLDDAEALSVVQVSTLAVEWIEIDM